MIISSGCKKVMCTQSRGEMSVYKSFELLQQNSENVITDNLLSLQRDMVQLNSLLKPPMRRSVKELILPEILVISVKITSLLELDEGNMESERK